MNHIQSVNDPEQTWCGTVPAVNEFYFKSLDQAALNGLFQDTKTACRECIDLSVQALLKNLEVNND